MQKKRKQIAKRVLAILLTLCMVFGVVPSGMQVVKPVEAASYNNGGCVRWVKDRAYQKLGISFGSIGNGKDVFNNLKGRYETGMEPRANSIACWAYSQYAWIDGVQYGHVAYVESVNGDQVTISQGGWVGSNSNFEGNSYVNCSTKNKNEIPTCDGCSQFLGYVYLTGQPNPAPNPSLQVPTIRNVDNIGSMASERQTIVSEARKNETDWGMYATIFNPSKQKITDIGIYLKDENGKLIGKKEELYNLNYNTKENGWISWTVKEDMGVTLQPGTNYKYYYQVKIGGTVYKTEEYAFKTGGTATPANPNLSISKSDYGINENIQVNWQKYNNATGFKVRIQGVNGTNYDRTINVSNGGATFTSFMLDKSGEYKVEVQTYNNSKSSAVVTLAKTITIHDNVTVTFVMDKDGEESVLKTQEIMWGYSADPPSAPTKKGHTFQGWSGSYENVKADAKLVASFKRNTYKIQFVDIDQETGLDSTVLKTENVLYEDSATPPEDPIPQKEGYIFAGWNSKEYENVQGNCTIRPSYVWGNINLPVIAHATSCKFEDDVYKVHVKLTNYPNEKTIGRVIVAMKTSGGKLLETTESDVFVLEKDATQEIDVIVPFPGVASYAEIVVVKDYESVVPLSENSKIDVTREWSEWTIEKPEGNVETEQRTEYRFRDKKFTTATTPSKVDWTLYNTTTSWGAYGAWSGWSRTVFTGSDSRQVQTQQVSDNNGYTTETYYFYKVPGKLDFYPYNGGGWEYREYTWNSSNPNSIRPHAYKVLEGAQSYALGDFTWGAYYAHELWWLKGVNNIPATNHTEYRYRDRSLITTYHFYQWAEWSDWSPIETSATDNKEVEQRIVYRSKDIITDQENNAGTERTISGKVSAEFAGKQATLFVYKHGDAADYNNEYVGQTVIGEDGSYSFTFKTREEPSQETGDFTIDLALEGATDKIYIDTIEAPKPVYTVSFVDYDGTVLSTQEITEGDNAVLPKNPTREHYNFTGWDTGTTNIHDDLTITAQYEKVRYTVIYVDWEKQDISFDRYVAGSDLAAPVESTREGYTFSNWLDEEGNVVKTVDRDMVLTAEYMINKYSVSFYDRNGELLSEQLVEYNKSAMIPETEEVENMVFAGWRANGSYINVKGDVNAYAQYAYIYTSVMPTASVESGKYENAFDVELKAEEGAMIYYTTDGSEPNINSNVYEAPITVSNNMVLRYIAVEENKNVSEIGTQVYLITANEDLNGAVMIKNNVLDLKVEDVSPTALSVFTSGTDATVKFYSVDENVATVTEDGQVQGRHPGETTVFAITDDLKYAASCTVTVTTDVIETEEIQLDTYYASLPAGGKTTLEAEVYPKTATYQDVFWFSDDDSIATVDNNGNLEAVSEGVTFITAYSYSGNCYMSCTVVVEASGLSFTEDEFDMEIGDTYTLQAKYDGVDISEGLTWKSSKETVATVDNGLVKAVAEGTTVITCTNTDGDVATVIVNVYNVGEAPSETPSDQPSETPSDQPSETPSDQPSETPSDQPSETPSDQPSETPSDTPNDTPSDIPEVSKSIPGDVDCDEKVTLKDAQIVLQAALGIITLEDETLADVNNDSQVTLGDAQLVLRAALGIISLEDLTIQENPSYSDEELIEMALDCYEEKNGYRPPCVMIDSRKNGKIVFRLYEDNGDSTATLDWYTVDEKTLCGTDFLGNEISLR